MYKYRDTTDPKDMTAGAPFGPGCAAEIVARAVRMEVWATSFTDPGPDFCEFRLFDATGVQIDTRRVEGY